MVGINGLQPGLGVGTPAYPGLGDFGSFAADLQNPALRDQALGLLGQQLNDVLGSQDPKAIEATLQLLKILQLRELMAVLAMLDPELQQQLARQLGVQNAPSGGSGGGGQPRGWARPLGGGGAPGGGAPGGAPGGGRTGGPQAPGRSGNEGRPGGVGPAAPGAGNQRIGDTNVPAAQRYAPGSQEARALFREAAKLAGVPESWADSAGLHNILRRESDGQVGRPNYTYGNRARDPSQWGSIHDELRNGNITARSSATGLGQLLLSNVDRYYPAGRAGIGDPLQEAAGMLRYIKDRYGDPDNAWRQYGTRHEGY